MGELRKSVQEISSNERRDLVTSLVNLLTEPDNIEKHMDSRLITGRYWMDNDSDLLALWDWLKDTMAMTGLSRRDARWVRRVTSGATKMVLVLQDITVMIAKNWMFDRKWDAQDLFRWIDTYIDHLVATSFQPMATEDTEQRMC